MQPLAERLRPKTDVYKRQVYTNGEASINVNMQNRQSISFQGELEMED